MKGFTLFEIALSVALISILFSISAPVFVKMYVRNEINIAAFSYFEAIYRARTLAMASEGDSPWGVVARDSAITVFKGVNFSTREEAWDEITPIYKNINITGNTELVFSKFYGTPDSAGIISFTTPGNNTKNISVNTYGVVDYE